MTTNLQYFSLLTKALAETDDIELAVEATEYALTLVDEPMIQPRPAPAPAPLPSSAAFAFDLFDRRAQGVLNRALEAAKALSSAAQRELQRALLAEEPAEMGRLLVAFIQSYRLQLTGLLGATQLAALLQGAQETARHISFVPPLGAVPPPPPTLPPDEALALLDRLQDMPPAVREATIINLPVQQQDFVRGGLSARQAMLTLPPPLLEAPPEGSPERIQWPVIEEATKSLTQRNILTPLAVNQVALATRAKSMAVASVAAREANQKIREALIKNIAAPDMETFRREVRSSIDDGTFFSDSDLEKIFRANIQSAFSDGQMKVLQHPFIRKGFPYAAYHAIHDDRVRETHLALERLGIGGTNIYRIDDPVFVKFRPPWDWNDRCGWTPTTVRMAASKGIAEALQWLETGIEPSPPAWVPQPPFEPPADFRRSVDNAPLSLRMSLESLEDYGAFFTWVQYRGEHGGMGWRSTATGEVRYQQDKPSERYQQDKPSEREEGDKQEPEQTRQAQQKSVEIASESPKLDVRSLLTDPNTSEETRSLIKSILSMPSEELEALRRTIVPSAGEAIPAKSVSPSPEEVQAPPPKSTPVDTAKNPVLKDQIAKIAPKPITADVEQRVGELKSLIAKSHEGLDAVTDEQAQEYVQSLRSLREQEVRALAEGAGIQLLGRKGKGNLLTLILHKLTEMNRAQRSIDFSLSGSQMHYGTEPPGPGWTLAGPMQWTKPGPRVAIVGGGPGGLFAAYILNQRIPEANITLFEASDRLGGKVLTDAFSDGTPFEAGVAELYEYLGPGGKDPLRALIENDIGLPTRNMSGGGVVLRGEVLRNLDDLEEKFGTKTRKSVEKFHKKVAELMPLEKYARRWQPDNAHPWADKTFRECIRAELGDDEVATEYVETACASDLATESYTCNGLNGIKNVLLDNDKYMQLYHVVGGIERVVMALVERVNVLPRLQTRVLSVAGLGSAYGLTVLSGGQETVEEFDYIVLAIPNHWLTQLRWPEGKLREAIHKLIAHYDLPAHYFRVSMLFDQPWWHKYELPGDFFMMDMCNGCCAYDESKRWGASGNHVLSFLLAGQDALLMTSFNGDDKEIARHVLDQLPESWREEAWAHLLETKIDSYAGSINAQPGGWPVEELRGEHQPDKEGCPGLFIVGDFFFDSTLNAALISAHTAVDLLLEQADVEGAAATAAIESLASSRTGL